MHVHIVTYISKVRRPKFFYISSFQKKYGVIVQNGAHTLKIHIWSVYI
jgi:hypothetical protein